MEYNLAFAPQLPVWLLIAILIAVAIPVLTGLFGQVRGSIIRLIAFAILALALLNPSLLVEDRDPLKSIVAVVTDSTASQKINGRAEQTEATRVAVMRNLAALDNIEIREISAGDQISSTTDVSTALFAALKSGLKDVAQERLGGAIMITDGQVHDIPEKFSDLGINAPIHALITGRENEKDRQLS